jgi:hypothetical protein
MGDWKIIDKVAFTTVNNTSSNNVAVSHVKSILIKQSPNALELNGQFFHMRCAAHVINLLVKDGLKNMLESIIKLQDSVQYSKSTPSRKHSFQDAIKSARMKQ